MADNERNDARVSPDGDVAQRFPNQIHGGGQHWIVVHTDERGDLAAQALHDGDVEDWPELRTPDELADDTEDPPAPGGQP